jgi:hypothetical protein
MDADAPIPESPVVHDSFTSPEVRQESTFQTARYVAEPSQLTVSNLQYSTYQPRVLADPNPESILAALEHAFPDQGAGPSDSDSRAGLILRSSLQWAIEYGDADLLAWLADLEGRWVSESKSMADDSMIY